MKQVDPKAARQGLKGQRILVILLISLVLVAVVWAAVEFYGQMSPGSGFMDDDTRPPASTESQPPASATGQE